MGERLRKLKRGLVYGVAALGIMSSSGFLFRDNNLYLERIVQEQYERQDIDGAYDYDTECIPNLEETLKDIRQSTYQIRAHITIIVEGGKEPGIYTGVAKGSGLLLENGYVLTAAHVVSETLGQLTKKDSGGVITFYSVNYALYDGSREYGLNPLWTDDVWTKSEDFALLKFAEEPDICLPYFHYKMGDTDKLRNGSVTYTFSAVNYPDIKEGNVLDREKGGSYYMPDYFFEDTVVRKGDSGGPVIAFLDGEPQLIGITCTMEPEFIPADLSKMEGKGNILKINVLFREAGQFFEIEN